MTTPGDEDVRRLDVAMDDALAVRRVESIGDFDSQRKRLFGFHRPSGDLVSEGCSVEELHHHKGAALTFSDVAVMRPTADYDANIPLPPATKGSPEGNEHSRDSRSALVTLWMRTWQQSFGGV